MAGTSPDARFAIMFEYRVPPERRAEFEQAYGGEGPWARFFGQDDAYRGTELMAFTADEGRYLVVDRWDSKEHYRAFRELHRAEYEQRSAQLEPLYASEHVIGELIRL